MSEEFPVELVDLRSRPDLPGNSFLLKTVQWTGQ